MTIVRVAQLSDTHFLEDGEEAEGGFAYDTTAAFAAVHADLEAQDSFDLIAVTGDIADHGRREQYRQAGDAFARFSAPVNVCPGNHDQNAVFGATLARPGVSTSRVIETGSWCFIFADSNSGAMSPDASGRLVDPASYDERLHGNGALGPRETAWIREMADTTIAEHVFVWIHHPPAAQVGLSQSDAYEAEWRALVGHLPKLRGIGAGHTHVPQQYELGGVPVYVCPALKNNFDLEAETMLPPGSRTYEFHPDGSITTEVRLTDDPQWPRHPLGRAVLALMRGELSWDDFNEIVARKRAASAT